MAYCQSMASSTLSKPSGREFRIMGMCGSASMAEPGCQYARKSTKLCMAERVGSCTFDDI